MGNRGTLGNYVKKSNYQPKETYTVSKIKRLLSCSDFANNPKGSIPMTRGSLLHSMLELGIDNYDAVGSEYRGTYSKYNFMNEIDVKELEKIAKIYMFDHTEYFTNKWIKEKEINCVTKSGYKISGIVDAMLINETSAVLNDWKSGISRANPNNELDIFQGIFYSYIIFKSYPSVTDVKFNFQYIESETNEFVSLNYNINDLSKLESIIERYIFALKFTGVRVNYKCSWCNNKSTCSQLNKEASTLNDKPMSKIKNINKAINSIIKEERTNKIKNGDTKHMKEVELYYVDTTTLSDEDKMKLVKNGKIKISKELAIKLNNQGIEIETKKSYRS